MRFVLFAAGLVASTWNVSLLPPSPVKVRFPPDRVQSAFESLMLFQKHCRGCGGHVSRFLAENESGYREARLLAFTAPEEVTRLAIPLALNRAAHPRCRGLALFMLGHAFERGNSAAGDALKEVALWDKNHSYWALELLAEHDRGGRSRGIFLRRALQGDEQGFEMLSRFPGWLRPAWFDLLQAAGSDPASALRPAARAASRFKERMELSESSEFPATLEDILMKKHKDWIALFQWGLHYGSRTFQERFVPLLRRCLDQGNVPGRQSWGDDDLLLAYVRLGGIPTPDERVRLEEAGYLADPAQRLLDLLPKLEAYVAPYRPRP